MGRLLLIWRLALRDLRHRPVQAVLLLLAITAATSTLTLGLALNGVTSGPYLRTAAATNGPDVAASVLPSGPNGTQAPDLAALQPKWLARVKLHALSSQRRSFCANSSPITTVFSIAR